MNLLLLIKTKLLRNTTFFAFKLSDIAYNMLINVQMPTIVRILTFMSMIDFVLSLVVHEKSFINSWPDGSPIRVT